MGMTASTFYLGGIGAADALGVDCFNDIVIITARRDRAIGVAD